MFYNQEHTYLKIIIVKLKRDYASVFAEELKGKLPLNLEDLGKLSMQELRRCVDECVRQVRGERRTGAISVIFV